MNDKKILQKVSDLEFELERLTCDIESAEDKLKSTEERLKLAEEKISFLVSITDFLVGSVSNNNETLEMYEEAFAKIGMIMGQQVDAFIALAEFVGFKTNLDN